MLSCLLPTAFSTTKPSTSHVTHKIDSARCQDRKGTFVHPDYQKRGFGTWITRACNDIADREGAATYVTARPSSIQLFRQTGFQVIGERNLDMRPWGGTEEGGRSWFLVKEPKVEAG